MGLVILAVSILIGAYMIGSIYSAIDQTGMPSTVTAAMDDTLANGTTGITLLGVSLIVMAAVFILQIMGSRN